MGEIRSLSGPPIRLSGRISGRVPFGTGAAMQRWFKAGQAPETVPFIHPRCFWGIRHVLALVPKLALMDRLREEDIRRHLLEACKLPQLVDVVEHRGLLRRWSAAHQRAGSERTRKKQIMETLDGFSVLKILHALRDQVWGSIPLTEALEEAPFAKVSVRSLQGAAEQLAKLEREVSSACSSQ